MKLRIDIDCTPEEARRFLGLPDVSPLHDAAIEELQGRMREAAKRLDPETLLRSWMPPVGGEAWQGLQDAFWKQFRQASGTTAGGTSKGTKGDKDT